MRLLRRKSKVRIPIKSFSLWLFFVLLTLPHMNPEYLNQIPQWDMLINIGRIMSFLVLFLWVAIVKRKASMIVVLITIQQSFLVYTTIIHKGEIYNCLASAFSVISVLLLYDLAWERKKIFLSSQLFCFELVIYINLLTIIFAPEGLYISYPMLTKNWFLGYYNNLTRYYIPALLIAWMYRKLAGKKFRVFLLTVSIIISAVWVWSGGVLVALFGMLVVYLFLKKYTAIFNYYIYWIIGLFSPILFLVFKFHYVFRWMIDGILGKWGSLLARMDVWQKTYKLFLESPLTGHGIKNSVFRAMELGISWKPLHAHNLLLEILYQGGIIGLILWLVIVIVAGKKVYRYRNTTESELIATAFTGWCITSLVEPFGTTFLISMFVIAYHSNTDQSSKTQVASTDIMHKSAI